MPIINSIDAPYNDDPNWEGVIIDEVLDPLQQVDPWQGSRDRAAQSPRRAAGQAGEGYPSSSSGAWDSFEPTGIGRNSRRSLQTPVSVATRARAADLYGEPAPHMVCPAQWDVEQGKKVSIQDEAHSPNLNKAPINFSSVSPIQPKLKSHKFDPSARSDILSDYVASLSSNRARSANAESSD